MTLAADLQSTGKGRDTGPFRFPWRPLLVLGLMLGAVTAFIVIQQGRPVVHAIDGYTMGSTWSVRFVGGRDVDVDAVRAALEGELAELNRQLSGYQPDTELSVFNRSPIGEWQALPAHLAAVLSFGKQLHESSGGGFDMTLRPLVNLWGFGAAEPRTTPPSDAEIAAVLSGFGSRFLEAAPDGTRWRRTADVSVDVDATAPGYAADVLSSWLAGNGHPAHLVEVGGELRAEGVRPDGSAWRVGIERPVAERGFVEQVIAVSGTGVATSGDYRAFFEREGKRYSHTLDPTTGRPVEHALASVTVLAPTGMEADGYATAIMVMGPEKGMAYADSRALAVYMLVREADGFREVYNGRFAPYLVTH